MATWYKRVLSLILTFAIILSISVVGFAAEPDEEPIFTADATVDELDCTVTVDFKVENNPGVINFYIYMQYDKTILSYSSFDAADFLAVSSVYDATSATSFTLYESDDYNAFEEDGVFLSVVFDISESAPAGTYYFTNDASVYMDISFWVNEAEIEFMREPIPYTIPMMEGFVYVTDINLSQETAELKTTGSPIQLSAEIMPEDATIKGVTWTSSNSTVASVSATGLITPSAVGSTTITAMAKDGSGAYATCEITVVQGVTGIQLSTADRTTALIAVGETLTRTPTVYPVDAYDKTIAWNSDNAAAATVDETSGEVTGASPGTARITATTADGGFTAYYNVVVTAAATDANAAKIGDTEYGTFTEALAALQDGETLTLLKDVAVDNFALITSNISLDLNGFTIIVDQLTVPIGTHVESISNGSLLMSANEGIFISGTVGSITDCTIVGRITVTQNNEANPHCGMVELIDNCNIVGGIYINGLAIRISRCMVEGLIYAGGSAGYRQDDVLIGAYKGIISGIYDCDVTNNVNSFYGYAIMCERGEIFVYSGTYTNTAYYSVRIQSSGVIQLYGGRYKSGAFPDYGGIYGPNSMMPMGYSLSDTPDAQGYYEVTEGDVALGTATFQLNPTDATIKVYKVGSQVEETPTSSSGGTVAYEVERGVDYTYTVSKSGYTEKTGPLRLDTVLTLTIHVTLLQDSSSGTGAENVSGNTVITSRGTYTIANGATGTITVMTREPVTLVGAGIIGEGKFSDLTIDCTVSGANLTIKNLWINNNVGQGTSSGDTNFGANVINFTGMGNTLGFEGENLLETQEYVQGAGIHVPKGAGLTFTGPGTLYFYKYSQGAGIGGNAFATCGTITFAGGEIFIKGSKTGPLVGGDALITGVKNDPIYITGGNLVLINKANGAAIGASKQGECAGNVYLQGGTLTIISDFLGSAIGYGGDQKGGAGNLYVSGGSFKAVRTGNSTGLSGDSASFTIDDSLVTATKLNGNGSTAVSRLIFDTTKLAKTASSFTVSSDKGFTYIGGLHYYHYTESTTSTPDNFGYSNSDKNLYFYLTTEDQILTINGEKFDVKWSADSGFTVTNSAGDTIGSGTVNNDRDENLSYVPIVTETTVTEDGKATTTVDSNSVVSNLVSADKNTVITIETVLLDGTGHISRVTTELQTEVAKAIAEKSASVLINTPLGEITLSAEALKGAIVGAGSNSTLSIAIDTDALGTTKIILSIGSKNIDNLSRAIRIKLPVPDSLMVPLAPLPGLSGTMSPHLVVYFSGTNGNKLIKKSLVINNTAHFLLNGTSEVIIAENRKTFSDVKSDDWFYNEVSYAASHELFLGVSENEFAPNTPMTRAMLVTVLWRLESNPSSVAAAFDDVDSGLWYSDAIAWANANGIVDGIGGNEFNPNGDVTREQLATILYRYAKHLGMDTSATADLSVYTDGGKTSSWAADAMKWAVGSGIITGTSTTTVDPQGAATRAQVATMLTRMIAIMVR